MIKIVIHNGKIYTKIHVKSIRICQCKWYWVLENVGIHSSRPICYNSLTSLTGGSAVERWYSGVNCCRKYWYWRVVGYQEGWNPFYILEKDIGSVYCNFGLNNCAPRDSNGDIKFKWQTRLMYEVTHVYEDTCGDTVQDIHTCMNTRVM